MYGETESSPRTALPQGVSHGSLCAAKIAYGQLGVLQGFDHSDVDFNLKTRIVVGNTGGTAPFNKESELAMSDRTTAFRDALLLYATRRWVNVDKTPPSR